MAYLSLPRLVILIVLGLGLGLGAQATPLPDPLADRPAREGTAHHLYLPAASPGLPNEGRIVETFDVGNYTYLRVEKEKGSQWLAVMKTPLHTGMKIRYDNGLEMKNFHSKSLNRTFESIMFLERIELVREKASE